MTDFTQLLAGGVPLLAVIFGLVEFTKCLGLKGRGLTVASLLLGLALGIAHRIAEQGMPSGFASWFGAVIFGVALGLTASGFYDFVNGRFPKASPLVEGEG